MLCSKLNKTHSHFLQHSLCSRLSGGSASYSSWKERVQETLHTQPSRNFSITQTISLFSSSQAFSGVRLHSGIPLHIQCWYDKYWCPGWIKGNWGQWERTNRLLADWTLYSQREGRTGRGAVCSYWRMLELAPGICAGYFGVRTFFFCVWRKGRISTVWFLNLFPLVWWTVVIIIRINNAPTG